MQQADKRSGNWRWQVASAAAAAAAAAAVLGTGIVAGTGAGAGDGDGLVTATRQEHVSDFPISRCARDALQQQRRQPQMMPLGRVAVPRRSRHLLQCRVLWFPAGWACLAAVVTMAGGWLRCFAGDSWS